jgi:hypothetical protein
MRQINVNVQNGQNVAYNVHVYDQFAGGRREVTGSPFSLVATKASPYFSVNADDRGNGVIAYSCDDGGPSQNGVPVRDNNTVQI